MIGNKHHTHNKLSRLDIDAKYLGGAFLSLENKLEIDEYTLLKKI